jgi:hypothetical protein
MLVILCSAHDSTARSVVEAWAPRGAALCTPADLSTPGWRYSAGKPDEGAAVVAGQIVPVQAITGVLTRLPAIHPDMLPHIHAADRDYVAGEMTAFLIAFLSALPCRLLNRPTAGSLLGPAWRPEQWTRAATKAGIPVRPIRRSVRLSALSPPESEIAAEVTLIGDRIFGDGEPSMAAWAHSLAHAAGVGMLTLGFARYGSGLALAGVDPMPDLNSHEKIDAAREFLLADSKERRP